ncbi:uncharacterized protein LOC127874728 isoform X2 [Dreissena polymorpha]|uniref:ADF-H domain-containing protein n=1 Tax=Dreissena polymorpha TaxID=45954 RepID=A0A9D4R1D6_DREPO|nr:uncharacterized protein LOC127874728 isoform X2 [Dreissena polymorpha]KAH3851354.1 hypothetical protein DPMN_093834 [Dreissena polymorpha]
MASSGCQVAQDAKDQFKALKERKLESDYVVFKIEKEKEVIVDKIGGADETFEDFAKYLKNTGPRYAVYNVKKGNTDRLLLVSWISDNAKIKEKMVYSSTLNTLKSALNIDCVMQCNDEDDLTEDAFQKAAFK